MNKLVNQVSSQFSVLILMSFLAVSLPLATNLVKQSQDDRSRATETSTSKVSFKIAFKGVKPSSNCLVSLNNIKVAIGNVSTNFYQSDINASITPVSGETNNNGDQVFLVSKLILDSKFNLLNNFNYVRVKGPFHLSSRMCLNNQNTKLDEMTTCDISLKDTDTTIYNFSNYALVPGDINQDGITNGLDYSIIKNNFNADAKINCGQQADINYDGIVNSLDANLFKESLSKIEDGKIIIKPTSIPTKTPTATINPISNPTVISQPTKIPTLIPTQVPTKALTPTIADSAYTTFNLTFYTSLPIENGGYANMACGGKIVDVKEVIYVANNVYPCGTKIYLEGYGVMTVKDRGGKSFNSKTRLDVLIPRNAGESDSAYFRRVNDKGRPSVRGYVIK